MTILRFLSLCCAISSASGLIACKSVPEISDEERAASVKVADESKIDSVPVRNYLFRRIAWVTNLEEVDNLDLSDSSNISFSSKASGDLEFGSATAIDSRGYFLTAAHCLVAGDVLLFISNGEDSFVEKARIVWNGFDETNKVDFAVLHIPRKIEYVFELNDNFDRNDQVYSAGTFLESSEEASRQLNLSFVAEPISGIIMGRNYRLTGGSRFSYISHDSPLQKGFSGGPLMDRNGKLLGVNILGTPGVPLFDRPRYLKAIAIQPDMDWLKEVIEQDAATL